jgi:hypothetical protein
VWAHHQPLQVGPQHSFAASFTLGRMHCRILRDNLEHRGDLSQTALCFTVEERRFSAALAAGERLRRLQPDRHSITATRSTTSLAGFSANDFSSIAFTVVFTVEERRFSAALAASGGPAGFSRTGP